MKKIISMLLVLAMLLAMVPMVLAETYFDQFNAIVTANTSIELGEKEDVYCQVWGVDYEDSNFLGLTIDWYITDKNVIIRDERALSGHQTMPFFITKGGMV